jgi:uncharacterized protein YggL (DUF469 family)
MTAPCPTFGFRVVMDLDAGAAPSAIEQLRHAWSALLQSRGLTSRESGVERFVHVVTSEASQATETDRVAIRAWLATRPEIRGWRVGDLEDLGQND